MLLHDQIDEALSAHLDGWCSREKAHQLASCVLSVGGGTVVEIGTYAGRSFFPMSMAVKHLQNGVAVGIDPYETAASTEGENDANAEWWRSLDHRKIEYSFLEGLEELRLRRWTRIIREKSENVPAPACISVLHIDGNHTEKAITDAHRFASQVVIGGYCCLDDISWDQGKVQSAMGVLKSLGFVERRRLIGKEDGTRYANDWALWQRVGFC